MAQPDALTIEETADLARQNNLDIKMAEQDARLARNDYDAARIDFSAFIGRTGTEPAGDILKSLKL